MGEAFKIEDYEDFGNHWRKEMMKMKKEELVDFIARICKENIKLKDIITESV